MDAVRQWALSLCVVLVASGILYSMAPSSSMARLFNLTVTVFFFCCLIAPLSSGISDFSLGLDTAGKQMNIAAAEMERTMAQQTAQIFKDKAASLIREELKNSGTNVEEIEVFINITDGMSISISEIAMVLDWSEKPQAEQVKRRVQELTGVLPSVTIVHRGGE